MQLAGDGPVRLLVVECTDALLLRATAQWDAASAPRALGADATLAELAGGAGARTADDHARSEGAGTMYQGIVALEAASRRGICSSTTSSTSEQLPSRLLLATRDGTAAGLLLQRLPSARRGRRTSGRERAAQRRRTRRRAVAR